MVSNKFVLSEINKEITSAKGQIKYAENEIKKRKGFKTEAWAVKEYKKLITSLKKEILELQKRKKIVSKLK